MLTPQECYKKIYSVLSEYDTDLKKTTSEIKQSYQSYMSGCAEVDAKFKDMIEENAKNVLRVNAFIDIAKAHITDFHASDVPLQFDSGALSRLTVQIDNSSRDDAHARQLYYEATGQLLFLEQQKDSIKKLCEDQKSDHKQAYMDCKFRSEERKKQLISTLNTYFSNDEAVHLLSYLLKTDTAVFGNNKKNLSENIIPHDNVSIGVLKLPIPSDPNIISMVLKRIGSDYCNTATNTIKIPISLPVTKGGVLVAEYSNDNESQILSGIRNLVLNIARYYDEEFDRVCFIDPVRFSNNTLGCLALLAEGNNSFIDPVPLSTDDIRKKIKNIIDVEVDEERTPNENYKKKIYIFHNFPHSYDSDMITKIQQLCVNAEHYEAIVILTNNTSGKSNSIVNDSLKYIQSMATNIKCVGKTFKMNLFENGEMFDFEWYEEPESLPESVMYKLVTNRPIVDKSNDYLTRVGINRSPKYKKGLRRIENIPYGVDSDGNLLTLDFENTNFATFICGASRSGKSTLLHTIITGILQSNHPDDIEMWLIDFKMTEFSRYIKHLPPHVRYIILDESPELVYDIIDRLTEIMQKRQSIFMGKWEKLGQVPPEKYMPAMFIIIDEFSVMSNIIADSVMSSRDNYVVKMQTLLAKGAALGMHFIFSSQGFTSGTRGLNDFSKKQVQQRIAMKTEYSEIKDTLDLKSASDVDKALMEQLPVYHTLTRVPTDEKGNHLRLAEVLYIVDYDEQEKMIDCIKELVVAKPKYDVSDTAAYIDKRAMVVDGNSYASYESKNELIIEHIEKNKDSYEDSDTNAVFIGEPQRMLPIYPVKMAKGFCENVLLISPVNENASCSSIILSASNSLKTQGAHIACWTTKKNSLYRQLITNCHCRFDKISVETEEICSQIKHIKNLISEKKEANTMIVLLGFETIISDMSYAISNSSMLVSISSKDRENSTLLDSEYTREKREDGEDDLNSLLDLELSAEANIPNSNISVSSAVSVEVKTNDETIIEDGIYDAREDLKFILTQGPRLGYHFMMVYNTVGEFEQSKIAPSLFKHKILFRTVKNDAVKVVSSSCAGIVSELKDHTYRYTDGLDEVSFRPYLHIGISIDGWTMLDGNVMNIADEEEEYLL